MAEDGVAGGGCGGVCACGWGGREMEVCSGRVCVGVHGLVWGVLDICFGTGIGVIVAAGVVGR